ncbi:MAG: hypothetical protein DRP13_03250 [Candidatus Aenigmatarchaeota archaeon]|nr:MAG: hypothetical protein DRP16_04880 [Candidatus Aenigmarchaeota archaeon]RLJ07843.1 MAG: hypothetical protein DRP13_03250 [Candidatus Aenigmarchaeota archaeon]
MSRKSEKNTKTQIFLIILMLVVIVLSLYIFYDKYTQFQNNIQTQAYTAGYRQGVIDTVVKIIDSSSECRPVPVFYKNTSVTLVNINCTQ